MYNILHMLPINGLAYAKLTLVTDFDNFINVVILFYLLKMHMLYDHLDDIAKGKLKITICGSCK